MANDKQQEARDALDASRRRRREAAMIEATATDVTPPEAASRPAGAAAAAGPAEPPAAAPPPPPPPPAEAAGRGLGAIPAALLGGVAGAAIASLIFLAAGPKDSSAELQARLAAFDARLKGAPGAEALAALDRRLAAAEQQARAAAAGVGAADQAAKAAEGVARAAEGLARAASGAADSARQEGRQEAQRLSAALAALPRPSAPVAAVDLTPLEARLTRAEEAIGRAGQAAAQAAQQAAAAAVKPVETRLAEVEGRPVVALKPVEERLAQVEQATRGVTEDLQRRLAALEPRIAAPVDLKPVNERVAQLEARLTEQKSEARVTAAAEAAVGQAATKANSIAVAAQAMIHALDRGAAFELEAKTLEGLGVDAARLAPVKRYAAGGAPTARRLAETFAPLANAVAANAGPGDKPAGVGDRLLSAAGRLVQVRRVGEAGDDAPALASRIEGALARGALAEALAAWAKLPGPAKAASQAFGSDLAGRVAADEAARAILADAFAALGRKS